MQVSSVIKLGGSLLDLPDLPARVSNFLGDFARPCPLALCGGGSVVDLVRRWDRVYSLGEEPSHWIALQALTVNALLVARVMPRFRYVKSPDEFPSVWSAHEVPLYDTYSFVKEFDEKSRDPLPRRWRVTSDSIAARMALHFGAPEVILLKSVTLPEGTTVTQAAEEGIVDPYFPVAARDLERVLSVNLQEDPPVEQVLWPDSSSVPTPRDLPG